MAGALLATAAPVYAEPAKPADAKPATAPAAKARYSTSETELGVILDDPAAKAIVEKHIPGLTTNEQVDMARAMTLKDIQAYSPDAVTDEKLAAIDADFAKL
jgi:para-nitrobenzyl esterase